LEALFDPNQKVRESACGLELAACRSIVRRLHGRIEARARPEGGLIVIVTLPTETGEPSI